IAILFVLNLWLGIYIPGNPAEWSWSYMFLALLLFLFSLHAAGRSLGFDAWLRRHVAAVRDGQGFLGRLLHVAGCRAPLAGRAARAGCPHKTARYGGLGAAPAQSPLRRHAAEKRAPRGLRA